MRATVALSLLLCAQAYAQPMADPYSQAPTQPQWSSTEFRIRVSNTDAQTAVAWEDYHGTHALCAAGSLTCIAQLPRNEWPCHEGRCDALEIRLAHGGDWVHAGNIVVDRDGELTTRYIDRSPLRYGGLTLAAIALAGSVALSLASIVDGLDSDAQLVLGMAGRIALPLVSLSSFIWGLMETDAAIVRFD